VCTALCNHGQNEMKDRGHLCHRISTGLIHEFNQNIMLNFKTKMSLQCVVSSWPSNHIFLQIQSSSFGLYPLCNIYTNTKTLHFGSWLCSVFRQEVPNLPTVQNDCN